MSDDFKRYVERYCNTYGCTFEEALQHKLVAEVGKYYQKSKHSPSTVQGEISDLEHLQT